MNQTPSKVWDIPQDDYLGRRILLPLNNRISFLQENQYIILTSDGNLALYSGLSEYLNKQRFYVGTESIAGFTFKGGGKKYRKRRGRKAFFKLDRNHRGDILISEISDQGNITKPELFLTKFEMLLIKRMRKRIYDYLRALKEKK